MEMIPPAFGRRFSVLALLVTACVVCALAPAAIANVIVPDNFPTIQAAVNAVKSGAVADGTEIDVRPGTYGAVQINGTSKSMTIVGMSSDPSQTVVNAGGASRALSIQSASGTVTLQRLTFTNGNANNDPSATGNGGGLVVVNSAPHLIQVIFSANTAQNGGGAYVVGSPSTPTFENCSFDGNTASQRGGGLVLTAGANPTFLGGFIQNNTSTGPNPSAGAGGGGLFMFNASATITSTKVFDNNSHFVSGGIHVQGEYNQPQSHLELSYCKVRGNHATRASSGDNPAEGGGIHVEDNAFMRMIGCKVVGNTANTGGGLNTYRGTMKVIDSMVTANVATDSAGVGGFGGGIASNSTDLQGHPPAKVVIKRSAVRGNESRIGGGIIVFGDQVGSPSSANQGILRIVNSMVNQNFADVGQGGGIHVARTALEVTGSQVIGNEITGNSTFGGGLYVTNGSNITLTDATIAGNVVPSNPGDQSLGGGLLIDGGDTISISQSRIYDNSAATAGGGIFIGANGGTTTGTVSDSVIADNANWQLTEQNGGATSVTYNNNQIRNDPTDDIYLNQTTAQNVTNINTFNGLGKGTGNTSPVPNFAVFTAAPTFLPAFLGWTVARASNVVINDGASNIAQTSSPEGTLKVQEPCQTTFTLSADTGSGLTQRGQVTVDNSIACGGP